MRRNVIWIAVGVFVAANVFFIWFRVRQAASNSRRAHWARLQEGQAARLLQWERSERLPLDAFGLATAVDRLPFGDCEPLPPKATAVAVDELTPAQKDDLKAAVKGILQVYATSTGEALVAYMRDRGEEPRPRAVEGLKRWLTERGVSATSVKTMTGEELVVQFWTRAHYSAHWTSIAAEGGCVRLWRLDGVPGGDIAKSLGASDRELFKAMISCPHMFQPKPVQGSTAANVSGCLFADVMVVIEHDAKYLGELSPFFFRFQFHPEDSRWHPERLVHVETLSGKSPSLAF